MARFVLSNGRLSLFTPVEYLVAEDYFSNRYCNILKSSFPLLGDLVSVKRSDFLQLPNLGKGALSNVDLFLEQIAGYWLGYTIPPECDWWVYRKLFEPNTFSFFRGAASRLALEWIYEDVHHNYLWQIITDNPEDIETRFRKKGVGRAAIDNCLAVHGFSLGMELPCEVSEAVKFLKSKI
jgi:hypothetical protein